MNVAEKDSIRKIMPILQFLYHQKQTLVLQLTSEQRYNTVDDETLKQLIDALLQANADSSVKTMIIYGGDKNFAVGANLHELKAKSKEYLRTDERRKNWQRFQLCQKPIIAAVNGLALGAGNELVMNCDIVIAGKKAQFGQPEINLGLIPGAGGTQRLTHLIGKKQAMLMLLTGLTLSAQEALQHGLISKVCQDDLVLEEALAVAETINQKSSVAVTAVKSCVSQVEQLPLQEGLAVEYQAFVELADSQDRTEGINAFLEKRKPHFIGK